MDCDTESAHDDEEDLKKAMAMSLQIDAERAAATRREEDQLQAALALSRQTSGGSSGGLASPSAVQVRLSQSKLAGVPSGAASVSATAQQLHLTPMRSWFSVAVPDAADLSAVCPSPLRRGACSGSTPSPAIIKTSSSLLAPPPRVMPQTVSGVTMDRPSSRLGGERVEKGVGAKTATFCAIHIQNASFYQDRLGTNIGKTQKRVMRFSQAW